MNRTLIVLGLLLLTAAAAGVEAPGDESKPILHLDVALENGRLVPVSVARTFDGREIRRFPGMVAPTLSPGGNELAAVRESLQLMTLDGIRRVNIEPRHLPSRDERFFETHPAWSPDGQRVAAITVIPGATVGDNAWAIVVLDAARGTPITRIPIPVDTAAGCPYCMAFVNKFRWSPDGRSILLSWGNTIVANVDARRIRVVSETWSSADWCDSGTTVCFFEVDREGRDAPPRGFYSANLQSGERDVLLDGDAIAGSMLTRSPFVPVPLVNTSPDGGQLVVNSQAKDGGTVLRFYELTSPARPDLRRPDKTVHTAETIPQVVWSPSGRSIAAIAASGWTNFRLLRFDLSTDQWTVLAELALGSDTPPEAFAYKALSWAE